MALVLSVLWSLIVRKLTSMSTTSEQCQLRFLILKVATVSYGSHPGIMPCASSLLLALVILLRSNLRYRGRSVLFSVHLTCVSATPTASAQSR